MSNLINDLENIIYNLKLEFDSGKLPERAIDFLKTLKENLELELKDDELEQVSGGVMPKKITRTLAIALAPFVIVPAAPVFETRARANWLTDLFSNPNSDTLTKEEWDEFVTEAQLTKKKNGQGWHYSEQRSEAYYTKWNNKKRARYEKWLAGIRIAGNNEEAFNIPMNEGNPAAMAARGTAAVKDEGTAALNSALTKATPWVVGTAVLVGGAILLNHLKNFYASFSNWLKDLFYKWNHKGIDISVYKTVLKRIERRLKQKLVGREKEIDQIIEILTGYFESVVQSGGKFQGGLVLYLIGSPGTGKSTVMNIIEEEMGLGSCTVRMSDIVEDHGNGASSAATRLTMPIIKDNGQVKVEVDTEFTRQVKTGVPTLYCIDEVDKMRVHDSILQKRNLRNEKNEIMGGSIDEMLRNFGDTGQIAGQNVSGSILIATSNETIDDMKQLEGSLYNRYKDYTVQFTDFTAEDYKEIINRRSETMINYYKTNYFTDVSWSQDVLDYYADKFEQEKAGGRGAENLVKKARALLSNYRDDMNEKIYHKQLLITMDYTNKLQVQDITEN